MSQIRNALLALKQYGFSDKTLEEIYKYETFNSFINPLFFKNHVSYGKYDSILTNKERNLTKDFTEFTRFLKQFKRKMLEYKGIDTVVHSETLKHGGKTISVIPTSFEKIYPKENEKLFKEKWGLLKKLINQIFLRETL